jgi:hypothetical protein
MRSQAEGILTPKLRRTEARNAGPDLRACYKHKRDACCQRPLPGPTRNFDFYASALHSLTSERIDHTYCVFFRKLDSLETKDKQIACLLVNSEFDVLRLL